MVRILAQMKNRIFFGHLRIWFNLVRNIYRLFSEIIPGIDDIALVGDDVFQAIKL